MRFDIVTLFPELFAPHLTQGITRRAFESGQVDVKLWPLRVAFDRVEHWTSTGAQMSPTVARLVAQAKTAA